MMVAVFTKGLKLATPYIRSLGYTALQEKLDEHFVMADELTATIHARLVGVG